MDEDLARRLTPAALQAAEIGAEIHRSGWVSGFQVEAKGAHGDSVTDVDVAAEGAITSYLRSARPNDSIVGEESGGTLSELASVCWVIDPIDGTANYLRRSNDYAVSIGATIDGHHRVGVIKQTALDLTWVGYPTHATRNDEPIAVAERTELRDTVWATGFTTKPTDRRRQLTFFSELMTDVRDTRRTGSPALDLAHVADGTVDGYVEFGLGHWDYAAGLAIVEAAGGCHDVLDISPWFGPLVIAAGSERLIDQMRAVLIRSGVPNL